MTCLELLAIARKGRPNVRYAAHRKLHSIAAWVEALSRWVVVACETIDGKWVSMPFELLVDGKPTHTPEDWTENPEEKTK